MFFNKDKTILEKLQNHDYKDVQEKLAMLDELKENPPHPKEVIWMLANPDTKIREIGIQIVSTDTSKSMFLMLLDEVRSKGAIGKRYIMPLFARNRYDDLMVYLQKNISHADPGERKMVIEIIYNFMVMDRFLPILTEALHDPEEEIRYLAIGKLCSFVQKRDIFLLLLPMLDDTSDRIRHKIIQEMCKLDAPELVEHFFDRLSSEPEEIQNKMIATLSRLAKNPALKIEDRLIPELASEKPMSRDVSARLLAQMPNKLEIIRKFLVYTRGIAFWLRDRLFETMRGIAASIADAVVELLSDPDPAIQIDAMFLACYIEDRRIVPGVVRLLKAPKMDWWVKLSAIEILVKLKAPEIFDVLKPYQNDSDLKWCLISAYGEFRNPATMDFLMKGLQDNSRCIRLESLRAIAKFNMPQIPKILEEIACKSHDSTLRYEASRLAEERGLKIEVVMPETQLDKPKVMAELAQLGIQMEEDNLNVFQESQYVEKEPVSSGNVNSSEEKERDLPTPIAEVSSTKPAPAPAHTAKTGEMTEVRRFDAKQSETKRIEARNIEVKTEARKVETRRIEGKKSEIGAAAIETKPPLYPQPEPVKTEAEAPKELTQEEMLKLLHQKMEARKARSLEAGAQSHPMPPHPIGAPPMPPHIMASPPRPPETMAKNNEEMPAARKSVKFKIPGSKENRPETENE